VVFIYPRNNEPSKFGLAATVLLIATLTMGYFPFYLLANGYVNNSHDSDFAKNIVLLVFSVLLFFACIFIWYKFIKILKTTKTIFSGYPTAILIFATLVWIIVFILNCVFSSLRVS
jgi:hypothetical protein